MKQNEEAKQFYKEIKALLAELGAVFEWHDGILVESMQKGGLLLIDEISLVNDSVLERLNSVFERERTLTLSERSSSEAIKIIAAEGFNVVATMNPSGDFGKKELSPALRNRMTEIWVDTSFNQPALQALYSAKLPLSQHPIRATITPELSATDLFTVIYNLSNEQEQVSLMIFNMMTFVLFPLTRTFSALQRKPLSIRDVVNCIEFVHAAFDKFENNNVGEQVAMAVYHAVQLVVVDGLCLGIDVGGQR